VYQSVEYKYDENLARAKEAEVVQCLSEHNILVLCFCLKKGIRLIAPGTHYSNSKALKLQSVSPLYNAQQGTLDVAVA
jgi:hypothetical protein